jgi:hypothetical protein
MRIDTLVRRAAALAPYRLRFAPAMVLAALWLLTSASVPARAQDSSSGATPASAEHGAAVSTTKPEPPKPAGAQPTPQASPTPSVEKDSEEAAEPASPENESAPTAATPEFTPVTEEPHDGDDDSGNISGTGDISDKSFRWKSATGQALLFLAVQHGYAFTQPKTRRDLSGPFFRDYIRSVKSLDKWDDGGRFFTNYVAHPMQGSLLGFVWVQNDPKGKAARFGRSGAYWRSRLKAVAWSAAWSTQFEIGPISQASLGNVGLHGKQTWVDIVITPTGGGVWLVAEDALDRFVVSRIEARTGNLLVKIAARMLLNPTRSAANLLRFEKPWKRDRRSF